MEVFLTFVIAAALYFLPWGLALMRKAPNSGSVLAINLFLGWTLIGWVVALAMAMRDPAPASAIAFQPINQPGLALPSPSNVRACPFCAEEIKTEAIVCKHCGRDVPPYVPPPEPEPTLPVMVPATTGSTDETLLTPPALDMPATPNDWRRTVGILLIVGGLALGLVLVQIWLGD